MTKEQTFRTERERRLDNLAEMYPSDKRSHGYLPLYAEHLPKKCREMLEIGVAEGWSALLWDAFYGEDLDLHLIDLFEHEKHVSVKWCRNRGFVPHQGQQQNIGFLGTIKDTFDLIVDDGSHNADHQLVSFKHLFLNNLRSGGLYVEEDLHCNHDPFYWQDKIKKFEDTPKWMFQNFFDTGKIKNVMFNEGEARVFENVISHVIVYDKIAFIWKR